jgi:beta-galactosidase
MMLSSLLRKGALSFGLCAGLLPAQTPATERHTFVLQGSQFLLDGQPYRILSGEMHYPRIPRANWRDRFRKARAMGLNTVTTYAFWNVHEPQPGVYDFSGQNDLAEFIREAGEEGLHVILRPGPYVCAEWELGGYPAWLLKDRTLVLRSTDPKYTAAVDTWLARLAQEVRPLLIGNGGPIVAVQLENEYGAFGEDPKYLEGLRESYRRVGLADGVLFTSNQAGDLAKGSLPDLPSAVNFGSGRAKNAVAKLEAFRPNGPRMVGEYWAGWFDKWGEEHHVTDGQKEAEELKYLLDQGFSVSIYMFDGGSNFGWMNGADSHTGSDYHPDTESYDYDAPLDEAGNPREKYALFSRVLHGAEAAPALPPATPAKTFPVSGPRLSASLWRNLPMPVTSKAPMTFEELGQNYGYVLYRVGLDAGEGGTLKLKDIHSFGEVYVNQQRVGTVDRRLGQDSIGIPVQPTSATLDILVENTGRVNYSHAIRTEEAGLTGAVTLAGKPLNGRPWEMFPLPMDHLERLRMLPQPCTGPCFYQFEMTPAQPADTYLDTHALRKGQIWLGERNLGRFWYAGPQFTLFAPAAWMSAGTTPVTVFDVEGHWPEHLDTVRKPVFGSITHHREDQ